MSTVTNQVYLRRLTVIEKEIKKIKREINNGVPVSRGKLSDLKDMVNNLENTENENKVLGSVRESIY